jgi:hypothetical protein
MPRNIIVLGNFFFEKFFNTKTPKIPTKLHYKFVRYNIYEQNQNINNCSHKKNNTKDEVKQTRNIKYPIKITSLQPKRSPTRAKNTKKENKRI